MSKCLSLFAIVDNFLQTVCNDLIYRYGKWTHGTFEKLGIPGPKPTMYFGTVSQFGEVYTFVFLNNTCILHTTD